MDNTVEPSIIEFAAKFCNELDKTINSAFSPLVAAEITMSTKALRTYHPTDDMFFDTLEASIPSYCNLLSPKIKSVKGVILSRASKVYLNVGRHKVDKKQKMYIKKNFDVKVKNIDFSNSVDAAGLINKWVQKKTMGTIKSFIRWTEFDVDTNVIFGSGLYFKGIWQTKFEPDDTEETIFYLNSNETVNVFLMHRKAKCKYKDSSALDAQLILLPFKGEEAHMLVLLPKRITGLDRMLQELAKGHDMMAEVEQMSDDVEVDVNIPRFKIESETNLVEVLRKLGVTTIFDKAVHKMFISINEDGMEPKPEKLKGGTVIPRWKPRPIDFTADHPHLIVILCHGIPVVWLTFRGKFE